jgi:hypothetical protein
MKSIKRAAALTNLDTDLTPEARVDSRVNSSNKDACLLSSGSWVRIPPGTPLHFVPICSFFDYHLSYLLRPAPVFVMAHLAGQAVLFDTPSQ